MPYLLEIDQDVNCAFIKHEAPFDLTNLALSGDERLAHPGFRRKMNFLHDFTDLIIPAEIEFKTIADESKRIIREYNLQFGECKGALVTGDAQSYAKMHQFI